VSSEREHRDPSRATRDEQARRLRRVRLVLATVGLAALAHVLLAEDPWSSGAVERVDLRGFTVQGDAIPFVWCASLLLALVAGALALGARRWLGPLEVEEAPASAPRPRVSRAFLLAVAGAVCVCAALAVPRLDLGMWDDELYSARHSMVGRYRMAGDEARFVPVGWRETLWHYRMPNNHVPYSLAARVVAKGSLAALRPAERLRIEVPLRLPALLFGLAAIVATALLLLRLGFPAAGAVTAWILALHPWHVRYASEARGYALVLLLVPLLYLALVAVLRRGCWRHWIAFGGLQLLLLWTWPAALPVLVLANLVLVAVQARRARGVALRVQAVRQAVVGIAGAALFLELMLPNLIQLVGYTAWKQRGAMGLSWWREVAAHLLAGTPWRHRPPQAITPELAALFDASPACFTALAALATGAVLLGAARLAHRHGTLGLGLVAIFLLSPPWWSGLRHCAGPSCTRGTWSSRYPGWPCWLPSESTGRSRARSDGSRRGRGWSSPAAFSWVSRWASHGSPGRCTRRCAHIPSLPSATPCSPPGRASIRTRRRTGAS
jgi:hypothetical protein